ncbi:hypothetical protein FMN52_02075 [Marinobacter sp. BW6]|uniref:hypothetical protein n=1 Tax=Marinobacter sp. BW6 TaxID=2592624 RepID=UPI0011DEC961|nr:hypothetical protein [Marinobacter sp. BW6]TYC62565.1 hypothetical protein FMN52_02075 [Marinobacter sp. BW6]
MLQFLSKCIITIFLLAGPTVAISAEPSSTDNNLQNEMSAGPIEKFDNQIVGSREDDSPVLGSGSKNTSEQEEPSASKLKPTESDGLTDLDSPERQALEDINNTLKSVIANQSKESSMPTYQKFLIGSGVLGFVIAVCNLIFTFVHRSEDKAKSIIDDFWLREVIIPRAIEPIEEKILNNKFRYQDLKSLKAVEIDELIKSLDELRYSISIADVISDDLMAALEELLDELSIAVATRSMPTQVYSANPSSGNNYTAGDPFFNCYKSMLYELIQTHKGLNVKRLFGA